MLYLGDYETVLYKEIAEPFKCTIEQVSETQISILRDKQDASKIEFGLSWYRLINHYSKLTARCRRKFFLTFQLTFCGYYSEYFQYILVIMGLSRGWALKTFNPNLPWEGQNTPPPLGFFLHHPKTAQAIKLKLFDFKDTLLRHILKVKPVS